ncbi:MAG TPA: branched-chain amino acid ABC transporter substrate-binding protein [Candidatus Limnocylindrales bacterium]|jgi:branched-chain amino acid transport system substrate-binding protein|nr:branched-chain amino acid ABC transporter substrate-binding protein [Candidatus Limnocylindrales bacterium]
MKIRKLAAVAAVAALAFGACSSTPGAGGAKGEIEIWSSLPRQGSSKAQTDTIVNAINMAIEEAGGKAGGYTIKYVDKDDSTAAAGKWDEATEIKNANDAVANDKLVAYIGTFNSGAAKLSIPILCAKGIVMISPANTGVGLTKAFEPGEPDKYYPNGCKKNYTRVIPNDALQGNAGALWASQLGAKNVYLLDDTEVYGKGIADVFNQKAGDYGLTILGRDGIDGKAPDYKALAEKVKATNPDLVYYGGITQNNAGQLWRDLRDAMPNVKIMGPDGVYENEFIQAAAEAAEGSYITFGGVPPDKLTGAGADFVKKYTEKYPNNPAEGYTAYGYEAAKVVLAAIEKAAAKNPADVLALRAAVLDEVKATKDFSGALGTWSFDADGDTSLTEMSGLIVKGGEFVFETVIK